MWVKFRAVSNRGDVPVGAYFPTSHEKHSVKFALTYSPCYCVGY